MRALDLTGRRFWSFTAIRVERTKDGSRAWRCRCDCGLERVIVTAFLTCGRWLQCKCNAREHRRKAATKHGHFHDPVYKVWYQMVARCTKPQWSTYRFYGARGITVCDDWLHDFTRFKADMGPRQDGYEIDRIDVNGPYAPWNCRWATRLEQMNNIRPTVKIVVNGESMTLRDASRRFGVKPFTIAGRLKRGWDHTSAATTPSVYGLPNAKYRKNGQIRNVPLRESA